MTYQASTVRGPIFNVLRTRRGGRRKPHRRCGPPPGMLTASVPERRALQSPLGVAIAMLAFAVLATVSPAARAADAPPSPVAALEQALAAQPGDAVLAYFLAVFRAREGNVDGT